MLGLNSICEISWTAADYSIAVSNVRRDEATHNLLGERKVRSIVTKNEELMKAWNASTFLERWNSR